MNNADIEACKRVCAYVLKNPSALHAYSLAFLQKFICAMNDVHSDEEPPECDVQVNEQYRIPAYNVDSSYDVVQKDVEIKKAMMYKEKGDLHNALIASSNAIIFAPSATLFVMRGDMCMTCKQVDAALQHYAEAQKLNPNYAPIYKKRGMALFRLERFEEAAADLTQSQAYDYDEKLDDVIAQCKEIHNMPSKENNSDAIAQLLQSQDLMKIATNIAKNEDAMRQLTSNPMLQSLVKSMEK